MTTLLNAFLAAAPAAEQPSMLPTIIMFVALGAVMYFFMIRPQQKKQKAINNFRNSLTVGQEVVTIGGLHGTIKAMDDNIITLHVATGVDLRFEKAAINPTGSAPAQA